MSIGDENTYIYITDQHVNNTWNVSFSHSRWFCQSWHNIALIVNEGHTVEKSFQGSWPGDRWHIIMYSSELTRCVWSKLCLTQHCTDLQWGTHRWKKRPRELTRRYMIDNYVFFWIITRCVWWKLQDGNHGEGKKGTKMMIFVSRPCIPRGFGPNFDGPYLSRSNEIWKFEKKAI